MAEHTTFKAMDVAQVWVFIGKGDICAEAWTPGRRRQCLPVDRGIGGRELRSQICRKLLSQMTRVEVILFFWDDMFWRFGYWQIIVFVVFCSCRWFQLRGYGLWCLASVGTVVLPMSKTNWQDSSIIHSPFPGNGNIRWSPSYLRMSRLDSSASSCKLKAFEVEDQHVTGMGFMKGIVTDVSWWIQISSESIKFNLGISLYPCFPRSKYFFVSTMDVEPCGTVQLEQWQ